MGPTTICKTRFQSGRTYMYFTTKRINVRQSVKISVTNTISQNRFGGENG